MFKNRQEVSMNTFLDAIALPRNSFMEMDKDEKFILDGLQLLNAYYDLKACEQRILELAQNNFRASIKNDEIFREFDNADYFRIKISDIVSTIYMHCSKVNYTNSQLSDYKLVTSKNITISNIEIDKTIFIDEYIPDFNFKITNLGFTGLKDTDEIKVSLYNDSLFEKTENKYLVGKNISSIGQHEIITITNLPCPQRQYEYNLKIEILSDEEVIYSTIKQGINIIDRRRYFAL